MLCQNCKRNEATTHIRRIVNGAAAEYHLCGECAGNLGYTSPFGGLGLGLGELFGSFLGDMPISRLSSRVLRCETCGCTFEDIVKNGKIGCADCYTLFYDKLLPSVQRMHGQTKHVGKVPAGVGAAAQTESKIKELREQLSRAIDEQNFELAAQLRDEIKTMEDSGNEQ